MAKKTATRATAKKPAAKTPTKKATKPALAKNAEFPAVFAGLKAILLPYAPRMTVVKDTAEWYYLDTKQIRPNKKPVGFAAVHLGKAYVSFHLMSVYANPKLLAGMSPALKKRMQGKACFNFTAVDEALFAELDALTKTGAEWFVNYDWTTHKWSKKK